MKSILTLQFILIFFFSSFSQNHFNTNGVHTKNVPYKVFINATIHIDGEKIIENGTLIVQDNIIIHAGGKVKIPDNSIQYDLKGKHIYPSFIELNSQLGLPDAKKEKSSGPQYNSSKKGAFYWNEAIKSENDAIDSYKYDEK